ncbi:MAG TPA: transposase [Pirellulales bacterium]|jgi:hypothetical protein|nr:transposase [Pirellulales bacterium]
MANKLQDKAKERFWRGVLKRFVASGFSVRTFCRNQNLPESAFYAWRRTIGERDGEAKRPVKAGRAAAHQSQRPVKPPAFLPLLVSGNGQPQGSITLELAGGRVLRFPEAISAQRLSEIVAALEARTAP